MSACLCIGALLVSYSIVSGTGRLMHASKDNPVLHHQISIGYLASNILLLLICAYYSGRRQPNPSAAGVIYMGFSGVWVYSAMIWNSMSCDYVYSDTIFGLSVPVLLTPFVAWLKFCLPLMVWWFLGLVYVVLSHGVCSTKAMTSTSTATNDTVSETANSNHTLTRPLLV
eukprot:scaffold30026_cov88-Skeletonema_marinoi.AAC.1